MPTFIVSIPGGRVGHFLAGAAVASVIGGTAIAITSPDFTYSGTKAGRYSISPSAMTPRGQDEANSYHINSTDLVGEGCYMSGVNLPQGAIVSSITSWYQSSAAEAFGVFAYRHNLATNNDDSLAAGFVSDTSNVRKSVTHNVPAALRTVDNATFDYSYDVCLDAGGRFFGARINYTYKSAGD